METNGSTSSKCSASWNCLQRWLPVKWPTHGWGESKAQVGSDPSRPTTTTTSTSVRRDRTRSRWRRSPSRWSSDRGSLWSEASNLEGGKIMDVFYFPSEPGAKGEGSFAISTSDNFWLERMRRKKKSNFERDSNPAPMADQFPNRNEPCHTKKDLNPPHSTSPIQLFSRAKFSVG